jgi:MYXO-CTERM domain-containing protein
MPRFAIALVAALPLGLGLLPAPAAADSPPPDRFTPCEGHLVGAACWTEGCTCVEVTDEGCPGGAETCLSCETADGGWCGPTNYLASDGMGCSSVTPGGAAALGLLGLALLARRRPRR